MAQVEEAWTAAEGTAAAVWRARSDIAAGDLGSARATLRAVLRDKPAGTADDPTMVDAALGYASVLAILGYARAAAPFVDRARDAFVADASTSDRRLQADVIQAYVLKATGDLAPAASLYRNIAGRLVTRFGPVDRRTLSVHADLAVALHDSGQCLTGLQVLHRTRQLYQETYGAGDPLDSRLLVTLAGLSGDCGDKERAREYVDVARQICDVQPSVDTELLRLVATAARDGASSSHRCGRPGRARPAGADDLFLGLFAIGQFAPAAADPSELSAVNEEASDNVHPDGVDGSRSLAVTESDGADDQVDSHDSHDSPALADELARERNVDDQSEPVESILEDAMDSVDMTPSTNPGLSVSTEEGPADRESADGAAPVLPALVDAADGAPDEGVPTNLEGVAATFALPDRLEPSRWSAEFDSDGVDVPAWAGRPTAGYPTVPGANAVHPTWLTAAAAVLADPYDGDEPSKVGDTEAGLPAPPVMASRATFGRMRRRASPHVGRSSTGEHENA